ncbi:hypothetical protein C8J56DRAFT_790451 [Mycena floridula]|nr:hypothetical protein C8J56DRAFT_790451 [Mycena floridula]
MAEEVWYRKTTVKWYKPEFGRIMACGLADFRSPRGKRRTGASRLFRIVVSEAAYLIWKIRNERTIPDEQGKVRPRATKAELENRFFDALNARLALDCARTNKAKYGRHALRTKTVLQTWDGILDKNNSLPVDWTKESGVLVGKTTGTNPSFAGRRGVG